MHNIPYIDVHTHHPLQHDGVISVLNCFPDQLMNSECSDRPVSIGSHPWHSGNENTELHLDIVKQWATKDQVLAIGEIGLDRVCPVPLMIQEKCFLQQIELAEKLKKAVVIHCVRSFHELLVIKKKTQTSTPWLIHGFRGKKQIAESLLKENCFLSFGEALLIDKKLQDLFKTIPLNRILLETDESTHSIIEIYQNAAKLREIPIGSLKKSLLENYNAVFKRE